MGPLSLAGPSYNLDSRPASVQRTINMMPVPLEPGNERTGWVLKDVPGLTALSLCVAPDFTFTADPEFGTDPLTVQFTLVEVFGTGPFTFLWDFGDGDTSTEQNPEHVYETVGSFVASVVITSACGAQATFGGSSGGGSIDVAVCVPPDYTISAEATGGKTVEFTLANVAGTGPLTFAWDFGDGETSTEQNPTHEYAEFGSYTVEVTVTNPCGEDVLSIGLEPPLTVLQSFFTDDTTTDISAYENGAGTLSASGISVVGDALTVNKSPNDGLSDALLIYESASIAPDGVHSITIEGFIDPGTVQNATQIFVQWEPAAATPAVYHRLNWVGPSTGIQYRSNSFASGTPSSPISGRTHWAMVIGGSNGFAAYVNGVQLDAGGSGVLGAEAAGRIRIGYIANAVSGAVNWVIDSVRIRREEVYTSAFTPPTEIPDPDFFVVVP